MRKKAAFWIIMILANAVIGVISVRTYRNMNARITGIETHQKNYDESHLKNYNDKYGELVSAHQKNTAQLLRVLGVDGRYDFNNNLVREWDLNKFFNYGVKVKTLVISEIPEELRELNPDSDQANSVVKVVKSPAIVVGRYVLAASHTSDAKVLSRKTVNIMTPIGVLQKIFEFKVLEYNTALLLADGSELSLKKLYDNKEKDFILFEIANNIKAPGFPFEIGKSSELRVGHFLYINGQPSLPFNVARPGFVTALSTVPNIDGDHSHEMEISQSSDSGDSGSPLIAFRDGKPELIGIYLGWWGDNDNGKNTRSRALKIDTAVSEIKEKLGLDLRDIQNKILY